MLEGKSINSCEAGSRDLFSMHDKVSNSRSSETAQWIKVLATKPRDVQSIPGILIVEGENNFLKSSCDLHTCVVHVHTCTHHAQIDVKTLF